MTTSDRILIELIHELSPSSRDILRDFAEFLIAKQRRTFESAPIHEGWPDGFFDQLVGSISDPSFVRPPQGEQQKRLPIE